MCFFLLDLHGFLKSVLVNGKSLLLQDLLRQIEREAIRIIELECVLSGQRLLSSCLHFLLLFLRKHFEDKVLLLLEFRITILALIDYRRCKLRHESTTDAKHSSVSRCTAYDTAEHIAATLI